MPFIFKRTRQLKTALCLLLCFLLPLTGMAQGTREDSLVLGIVSTLTSRLNPLLPVEREFQSLTALVYEPMIVLDDNYIPQPCLAERWESSQDGASWTFVLREGVVFHDGTPLTSADVVATANEILRLASDETNANKGVFASLKFFIKKISAVDARTVLITTNRKCFGFLYAMTFPVLPAAYIQADNPPGSGPYVVNQFAPKDYLWLSVNSFWWGGRPKISEISTIFHAGNRELISSYEYNRVDTILTRSMTAAQYRSGVNSFNLSYRTKQLETLLMNNRSYELKDVNIRKAIRAAINLNGICDNAYMGMAQRTDTPLPVGTWMYQADEQLFRQNLTLANQLLDEAGWKDSDGDGMRDMIVEGVKKNLSLSFFVYEEQENSVRVNVANQIVSQLAAVGIEARLLVKNFSDVQEKLNAGSFDLAMVSFNMDYTPDPGFLLISGNTGNFGRYNSKNMDKLFDELRVAVSKDAYQQKLFEIQALYAQDCPFISLFYRNGAILTRVMFTSTRDIREPDVLRGIEAQQD